ncbi:MAG: BamA/TamA family outer membrane protein [Thermoanaerobaculia bacterium]
MRRAVRVVLGGFLLLLMTTAADAQYFGQNKVQWEKFDFKVLQTEHFDIYYYEQEADVVEDVGRMAERWYARLSRVFNHSFQKKPIVLYANSADFHQTTTTGGHIGEGTGGFTDAFMNRVVLPLTGDYAQNDHVLGHEIVHVFQYDIAANASRNQRRFALEQMPLWIVEGMAEYLSKGRVDPLTAMWVRDASIHDRLPDIRQLTRDPRYFPYRYGQAVMAYIGARFGDEAVVRYFLAAGIVGIEEGVERALGVSEKQLFADWKESARELYAPVIEARQQTLGNPLIGRKPVPGKKSRRRMTEMNIGPAVSPDGKSIAFLSSRELFSIDLFLADARTGEVTRRLVSSDRDAHFESLRFIESAGAWSPDSRRIAFITFARGDNFLSLVDVESRKTEHIKVPNLEAIMNVAWSPDGRTIALAGQTTGVSDLFLYDLETKQVRRLTSDKYADMQPAFSPDGRTLVFVTDRGAGTSLEELKFGDLRLATIDLGTGAIRELRVFANAKHVNPQWAPDGRSIYFISNPEGIADIYRHELADGRTTRIVAPQTGVAGITDLAPALSVASKEGTIVFSLFEDDNYNIYSIPATAAGNVVAATTPGGIPRAALLPPLRGAGSEITAYLSRPADGLPATTTDFPRKAYDPKLRLAYLGPPTLGVGVGEYGFAAGGSVSAWFSDILGQHNVGFTLQGGGSESGSTSLADSIGGELFYLNQKNRLNWGADLVHIPYVSTSAPAYSRETVEIDGRQVVADVYRRLRQVQTVEDLSALAQYPFSTTRRLEGGVGVQRYGSKLDLETWIFVGDQLVDRFTDGIPGSYNIGMGKASLAFVGDSSTFGFVSPIRGTRYRYEVETLSGDLNFQTALADWRKYFFKRPVTLAVRGLHYGRYGDDGENWDVISPLFLGDYFLMRGYQGIDAVECGTANPGISCPVWDRLIGSRIAMGSVEVRAPLFGTRDFGLINAPFLPTEIFAFGDIGTAWTSTETPDIEWSTDSSKRIPVASAGIGLRILLAYIPIEVYAAKPFQRPLEEVVYGFNITPGW